MAKAAKKPKWPHAKRTGVKMSAHPNGQWCKKIDGKLKYFGPWADPDGALARYMAASQDLYAGIDTPTAPTGIVTVADVFNDYVAHREPDVVDRSKREKSRRDTPLGLPMFHRYIRAGQYVASVVGRTRPAASLGPRDFIAIKRALQDSYGPMALDGYIRAIRTVFTWAAEDGELLDIPPRFGKNFRAHGVKRDKRDAKREQRRAGTGGRKMLQPDTLRALLAVASIRVRAMVLLGINCGFYAADCADLPRDAIDFEDKLIDFDRYKSGVDRLCPLWDETAEAIKLAMANRPDPIDPAHANRVFITQRGRLWVHQSATYNDDGKLVGVVQSDYLSQEFRRLFGKAGIDRPKGCGFGWLRHVFYTVARRSRDIDAVNAVMGHSGSGMTEFYLEDVEVESLRAVADHVHNWLFEGGT